MASSIHVRRAKPEDRGRILEISAQIWDGEDYVPDLLESWYADSRGELAVATWESHVIAFAHRTWITPDIAWLEGIRTDPAHRGKGAGKAITEHFLRTARVDGASEVHLSTYIDNEASIHIIETYGFSLAASFSYLESPGDHPPIEDGMTNLILRPPAPEELIPYIDRSTFLEQSKRRFPRGWKFVPFDRNPAEAVARLEYTLSAWNGSSMEGAVCLRQKPPSEGWVTMNFLDGSEAAMTALIHQLMHDYQGIPLQVMVPHPETGPAAAFSFLLDCGFTSWSGGKADVFLYEMPL